MKPTFPGRAILLAKVAFNPVFGFITPKQLGPIILIFPPCACCSISCSKTRPFSPASLKPAEIIIAPLIPASTQSEIILGTVGAGVAITAKSIFSGTSKIVG